MQTNTEGISEKNISQALPTIKKKKNINTSTIAGWFAKTEY